MIPLFFGPSSPRTSPSTWRSGTGIERRRQEIRGQTSAHRCQCQQNGTTRRSSLQVKIAALRPLPHSSRETGRSAGAQVRATARRGARLCLAPFLVESPTRKSPRAVSHKNPARQTWPPNPDTSFSADRIFASKPTGICRDQSQRSTFACYT